MQHKDTPQHPAAADALAGAVGVARPSQEPQFELERYRQYLWTLAATHVTDRAMQDRLDLSGVVQQTFLEAHEKRGECRGTSAAEIAGWLRAILAHNLADAMRSAGRDKRDANRQRSLDQELEQSSLRLGSVLASDESSPSQGAHRAEQSVLLAQALAELPEAQRQAVVLRHWHGRTLAETAAHMGRTPGSVVGLLQRGLKALRLRVQQLQQRGDL